MLLFKVDRPNKLLINNILIKRLSIKSSLISNLTTSNVPPNSIYVMKQEYVKNNSNR